ncbi:MAG: hypothetical protein QOJ23_5332 [Actinomycetota bacterium]|nr:hypothetical protein [Actinomycetota bacterium]
MGGNAGTTRLSRHIRAPRSRVYQALLDAEAVQQWMVPDTMTSQVHSFDAREGGTFRISLTGEMTITYMLVDAGGGTMLTGVHEKLPPGVSPADNELGTSMAIDKLAKLVEER